MYSALPTRARAEAWRQANGRSYTGQAQLATFLASDPRPLPVARPVRKLSYSQRLLCLLLTIVIAPFLLLAFLLVGERPSLTKKRLPTSHSR
jgi:hypothetical protein